ncbi:MAG: NB-ARC domain-containing protein [Caldilineaceae bacterium]
MSPPALSPAPIEQVRQVLRDRRKPAKLDASPWLHATVVTQKQHAQPTLAPTAALLAVLDELLATLQAEQPLFADLLHGRFWEELTVEEMVQRQRPESQSTRRFHQQQELALAAFARLFEQAEAIGRQTQNASHLCQRLPIPTYDELFGVAPVVDQLLCYLQDTHHHPILSIKGIGGIGKTALTDFVVRQALRAGHHWHDLLWVSAKQEYLTASGINRVQTQICIDQILNELGQKLQLDEVLRLSLAQKVDKLATALRAAPYLVVLDNLESVEDFRRLTPLLTQLANPTQFILTTRAAVSELTTVTEVNLDELEEPAARALILYTAHKKGVCDCDPAAVYALVGGNPLAIILVVSQMQFLPIVRVLERVREGATKNMYTYIYWQAWQLLDQTAQEVLFAIQRAGDHADWSWLAMATEIAPDRLDQALRQLYDLSLVYLQRNGNHQPIYALHRLTSTFLRTEVLGWK